MNESSHALLPGYQPVGGVPCLDLVNTVDWRASDSPRDLLVDGDAVDAWLAVALDHPPMRLADGAVARLRWLREAIHRLVTGDPAAGDLAVLNDALAQGGDRAQLVEGPRGYGWAAEEAAFGLAVLRARLARSAADLLVDPARLARVRRCHGEGCGWLFYDESRAGNRRWCSMRTCGNRQKARVHYRRSRQRGP